MREGPCALATLAGMIGLRDGRSEGGLCAADCLRENLV